MLQFTGKERDAETGLDYFLARYYSGAQGRFISVDPENAGAVAGDPQSWNAYSYALNKPLHFVDPTGKNSIDINTLIGMGWSDQEAFNFVDSLPTIGSGYNPTLFQYEHSQAIWAQERYEQYINNYSQQHPSPEGQVTAEWSLLQIKESSSNETSTGNPLPFLSALAGGKWHFDYSQAGERLIHYGKYRFNQLGQLVEHSGRVIGEANGKAARALQYLKNVKPSFFLRTPMIIFNPCALEPSLCRERPAS